MRPMAQPMQNPEETIRGILFFPSIFIDKCAITAAHIFGHALGQDLMTEIFGDEEGERDELFSTNNGMMMLADAES